ncbi:MAG: hypothetical protein J3K34DRAFT_392167 [Monoraphidium minutum]|nr:MAG: hypothetical protein J3K34DRAFT_392167 [Monoraphidium minutum]
MGKDRMRPSDAIDSLSRELRHRQAEVCALLAERRALQTRAWAVEGALGHLEACLRLGRLVAARGGGPDAGGAGNSAAYALGARAAAAAAPAPGGGGPGGCCGAAAAAAHAASPEAGGGGGCSSDASAQSEQTTACQPAPASPWAARGAAPAAAAGAPPPLGELGAGGGAQLHWSPEAAAARAASADLSVEGLRTEVQRYIEQSCCLINRVSKGAPDAAAAALRLEQLRAHLTAPRPRCARLAPIYTGHAADAAAGGGGGAGGGAGAPPGGARRGAPPPPPSDEHFLWAIDLACGVLDRWHARAAALAHSRALLLHRLASAPGGGLGAAEQRSLVARLDGLLCASLTNGLAALLPVCAGVFAPWQFASCLVACAPWLPSPGDLRGALLRLRDAGGGAAPAAAPAAGDGRRGAARQAAPPRHLPE